MKIFFYSAFLSFVFLAVQVQAAAATDNTSGRRLKIKILMTSAH